MLSKAIVHNRYLLSRHKELFNRLESACYFSSLGLRSGYWQVCIADSDVYKTTFSMCNGLFEWCAIPFVLTNAPGVSMCVMNWLF